MKEENIPVASVATRPTPEDVLQAILATNTTWTSNKTVSTVLENTHVLYIGGKRHGKRGIEMRKRVFNK